VRGADRSRNMALPRSESSRFIVMVVVVVVVLKASSRVGDASSEAVVDANLCAN
jgi:hypothetical protein